MPALDGVRVIDLTQYEAGTSCTQGLAWLGADVVKIERPGIGEQGRRSSRDVPGLDAYYFLLLNSNKRSVTLDLRSDEGKEILDPLCEHADVFVENFGPGAIDRLGFGYEELHRRFPKLIFGQVKGFDPDGPFADFFAFDPVAQAVGGSISITGMRDGLPLRPGPTIADTGFGLHLALGIVAALYQRESTGRGQKVSVAMQEAVINFTRVADSRSLMTGKPAGRLGNGLAMPTAPCNIYQCKPGGPNDYVMVYTSRAPGSEQWDRVLDAIGRSDLKGDERFSSAEIRAEHVDEVDEILGEWAASLTKEEAMRIMNSAGVPAGAVFDTIELSSNPELQKTGAFVTVDHPERGKYTMPGWPVKMTDSSVPIVAAPILGHHTQEVLEESLNIGREEFEALREKGVV